MSHISNAGLEYDPFPLTPTLSPRRGNTDVCAPIKLEPSPAGLDHEAFPLTLTLSPTRGSSFVHADGNLEAADSSQAAIRFSLSLGERAGVRGNGTLALGTTTGWDWTLGRAAQGFKALSHPSFQSLALMRDC